jgi:hypothetical protein
MRASIARRRRGPKRLAVAPVVILAENRLENTPKSQSATGAAMFFTFPEDAHRSAVRQAVEFGVEIGDVGSSATVRVPTAIAGFSGLDCWIGFRK